MQRLKVPNGLSALGYSRADIPALVKGTLPQHRVTKLSPRPASEEDLAQIFEEVARGVVKISPLEGEADAEIALRGRGSLGSGARHIQWKRHPPARM